ncbi:unnamed protein product [Polarella glacialis]|uniref:Uncharacterized protein n=1 Tax=Polarella glacialis TaxID=89957 RepID=A0A813JK57_POLGL|nr:unnamed protein product [Polarella glacialis]
MVLCADVTLELREASEVTSDVGDGRVQWYAFLALPPGSWKVGDSWEGSAVSKSEGSDVISYLKSLHKGWSSEVFEVLDNTRAESVEQRDLFDRWPEFFRSWADGNVVLVGDVGFLAQHQQQQVSGSCHG